MPYYELRPKVNENLRLNVSGTSVAANGQNVTLYSATGSNDQIWFVQNVGATGQTILSAINQAYGLSANTSGTWNCCLYTTGGNPSTTTFEFEYVDGGCWRVKLLNQDRYLTCDGSTSGSNVSWKAKTGGAEQVWRFYPTFVNGPQNYAYMKAPWGTGKTIHIIRTAASNIKLVNLERKSLSGGKVYGMNGGFFDPAPSVNILRKHRAISQRAGTARETSQSIPTIPMECPGLGERQSKSGRQATLVRQIQICQCKHHIQFFPLLHQPSVSRLSETEQSLDHRKNMLHLGTYR